MFWAHRTNYPSLYLALFHITLIKQTLAAISPSSFKRWTLDFMPSSIGKPLLKFWGSKLSCTQKVYYLDISDQHCLFTMPIFTSLSNFFSTFLTLTQISPKTVRDFTFLNVVSIKFSISLSNKININTRKSKICFNPSIPLDSDEDSKFVKLNYFCHFQLNFRQRNKLVEGQLLSRT